MFLGCPIGLSRHLSINCEHLVVLNRVCFMCFAVSKSDYQRLPNSINGIHSSGCFGLACQDCLFRTSRFGFKHIDCPSVVKLGLSEKKDVQAWVIAMTLGLYMVSLRTPYSILFQQPGLSKMHVQTRIKAMSSGLRLVQTVNIIV